MEKRNIRMGIDVGGTHTKAVAIDNDTHEIVGISQVKTTHDHPDGVAAGVVQSFTNCMQENGIAPDDIIFVAHSTTQATNALVEGDVAHVGVFALAAGGLEGLLAKSQSRIDDIGLGNGKKITVSNSFLKKKQFNAKTVQENLDKLVAEGAQVIVSSMAFGVDDNGPEQVIADAAQQRGLFTTMASDITKLYGLTRRTRTACINASILPKMMDTALSTEHSVRAAHEIFSMKAQASTFETGNGHVLGICRVLDGKKFVSYYNFSDAPERVDESALGDKKEFTDLVTGKKFSGDVREIGGYGYLWLYSEKDEAR